MSYFYDSQIKIPVKLEATVLERLIESYREKGDYTVCDSCYGDGNSCSHAMLTPVSSVLIGQYLRLAALYVSRTKLQGTSRDELMSELILTIVKTVQKAQYTLKDNNLGAYIGAAFKNTIHKFYDHSPLVRIPRVSKWRKNLSGNRIIYMGLEDLNIPVLDHYCDLAETIKSFSEESDTVKILNLIAQDYNLSEISEELGLSYKYVRGKILSLSLIHI